MFNKLQQSDFILKAMRYPCALFTCNYIFILVRNYISTSWCLQSVLYLFLGLLYCILMSRQGSKPTEISVLYNIIFNLIQLCEFDVLN